LQLWRGPALADVHSRWLDGLRMALDGERLAAALDRSDAELRRGRHAGLLAELRSLTAEHPLDERLAGQLMVAAYPSGGSAGALARCADLRRRLTEELGASPSPALTAIHLQVLRNAPGLAAAAARPGADAAVAAPPPSSPAAVVPSRAVPAQLPRD